MGGVVGDILKGVAGPIIGGLFDDDSNDDARRSQEAAARDANLLQKEMFDTVRYDNAPDRDLKGRALNQLATLLGVQPVAATDDSPGLASDPTSRDFGMLMRQFQPGDLGQDPGYQFRLNQDLNSINTNAGARGQYYSGATLKALQERGQQLASTEYQNAFNRDDATKRRMLNALSTGAQIGSNSAGNTQAAGQQYATSVGNNIIGMGNVNAASSIGRGNVWGDTVNNIFAQGQRNNWWGMGGNKTDPNKPYWE